MISGRVILGAVKGWEDRGVDRALTLTSRLKGEVGTKFRVRV